MNKEYYVLPKDDFLEVLIDTAKENYLLHFIKEKSYCVREMMKNSIEDSIEACLPETIVCIDSEIQCVKQMDNQEFLLHLLFETRAIFLNNNDLQNSFYNLVERLIPSSEIFVDKGYERYEA